MMNAPAKLFDLEIVEHKQDIKSRLLVMFDPDAGSQLSREQLPREVRAVVSHLFAANSTKFHPDDEQMMTDEIVAETTKSGPEMFWELVSEAQAKQRDGKGVLVQILGLLDLFNVRSRTAPYSSSY